MKKMLKIIALPMLLCTVGLFPSYGQDHIFLKDGTEVEVKVESITEKSVGYKKWNNLDGPTYLIDKSGILLIKYQNGENETFNTPGATSRGQSFRSNMQEPVRKSHFRGYVNVQGLFSDYGGVGPSISLGASIRGYAYLGLIMGISVLFPDYKVHGVYCPPFLPIGINLKGYIPTWTTKIIPYGELTLGPAIGEFLGSEKYVVFHNYLGIGCHFSHFDIGFGWDRIGSYNSIGIKIGCFFGWQ